MYSPLSKQLKLKKSNIHGYGLFANENIPSGTVLGISHVEHELFPDGWIRTPLGGFYNHSENPNCILIELPLKDLTKVKFLKALSEIKVDEELTCIYTIWQATSEMKYPQDK